MKITFWDISQAAKLTDFYNEQIATVPYCYPVSPEEFERAVCYQLHEALEKHKMNADKELAACSERRLIVGKQDGEVVGFADVGRQESDDVPNEDKERDATGLIRFMTYRPGCRPIGQAILEHAEQYFRDLGLNRVKVFTHKSYYFFRHGYGAFPNTMWHVQALFGMNGYRFATWDDGNQVGWFFLHFPHYHVTEPVSTHPGVEVDVQQISGRGELPNLKIRLCRNGQTIAYSWVLASEHYCLNPEALTIFNTESFGVYEPENRGKGLGRYLMQLKLWEMRKLGYQTATLLSSRPNYRAQLLYTNTGYRVVDVSCAFVKELEE